jgi:predicted acetyltransferase
VELRWPTEELLPGYVDALRRGWSADTTRDEAIAEELAAIESDPRDFVASMVDRDARGGPITLPDGSLVPRLPGFRLWMWDGELCGSIGARWQPGTEDLPPTCLGHIGYSVVPWKRRQGHATSALAQILPLVREEGLAHVILTTDVGNVASQRVIVANGGVLLGEFDKGPQYGGTGGRRFRIDLR